jgi:hypothetical protein
MSPASLETNYVQELKKCGSPMYKIQQHWVWTTTPTLEQLQECCFTDKDYLRKGRSRGIWVRENKAPNYDDMTPEDQLSIQEQIEKIFKALADVDKPEGLYYNFINLDTGKWCTKQASLGFVYIYF